MLTFEYTAKASGSKKPLKSTIQAESENAAAKLLLSQGIVPIRIRLREESGGSLANIFKKRIRTKDRIIFTRQLSTLLNAGLPLTQSLRTVAEQTDNKLLAVVVNDVMATVEGGNSFSAALARHPKVFNEVYIALVSAGEASGTMDEALLRIADQQEKDAELINKVRGAMIYPAIVLFVIAGVIIFMLTTVLPQVEQLYDDLGQGLPFITSVMLGISKFMINFWWLILLVLGGLVYFLIRYKQTDSGRAAFDRLKMTVPLFGPLFKKLYMARFCRTGQSLMSSGVQMLEMLRISGRAVDNVHVNASIQKASEKVKGGTALSAALEGDENFLPLVPQMINIGEQSGKIDAMMGKAAAFYENELDNTVKAISTIIEPALMVVLALVAGLLVGAVLLPVYGLVGQNLSV